MNKRNLSLSMLYAFLADFQLMITTIEKPRNRTSHGVMLLNHGFFGGTFRIGAIRIPQDENSRKKPDKIGLKMYIDYYSFMSFKYASNIKRN